MTLLRQVDNITLGGAKESGGNLDNIHADTGDINNTTILMRRLISLMESLAVVDSAQRQRIVVDNPAASPANVQSSAAAPINATLLVAHAPALTTQGSNAVVNGAPTMAAAINPVYVWAAPVDQRWLVMDQAQSTYAQSLRANLSF